uniref:Transcription factor E4F1 n=2 Tax=Aceria tosichella TaxID=561515 RepID=A0A6G1SJX5_9ACAR
MGTTGKVKSRWTRSFFTALNTRGDEERYSCEICQKDFASPSNLTLHSQVHVIERKFKCEPCQVSFHSQGHLQKHKRSSAHETRVQMTQAFGVPTSDNPRPYGCSECDTAFRKHGHLAKHLRSKSHITRLESRGLIPSGTYAALEKCGQDLKDKLVTTNYEQSLISMREIAMQLFQHQVIISEQQQQHQQQPSYSLPEQMSGGAIHDNHHDMMTSYPSSSSSSSMSAQHQQQQQQILSPTYFSTISTPPLQQAPQPAPMDTHRSMSGPSVMLPAPQQQPSLPPPPPPPQTLFQQQQHQPAPGVYLNDGPGSQMMVTSMLPHHHQQIHSLDYTIRSHHYQH